MSIIVKAYRSRSRLSENRVPHSPGASGSITVANAFPVKTPPKLLRNNSEFSSVSARKRAVGFYLGSILPKNCAEMTYLFRHSGILANT
ncbi:hypothetical protein NXC24_CH01802 [Rhizobium sp. NXC24]|nr:hypothetical protein NXC24_CH01802 [Rhizobium sp. NXC24]